MATARVLEIYIPAEDETTHFNLRYSTDATTWTDYSTTSASPSSPSDIVVGSLDADGNYLLDGVNSPTGNKAAASYDGNWYQYRLKASGGYASWSDALKIVVRPETDGPLADVADLRDHFGLLGLAFAWGDDEPRLDRSLAEALTEAMDEARIYATAIDTLYTDADSTRTTRQTRVLQRIEKNLAAGIILKRAEVMKATGTHEPLLMEDAEQIAAVAAACNEKAQELLANLTATLAETPRSRPFAMPAVGASTFTRETGDRSPSERNDLIDESDDIGSDDLDNG